MRALLPALLILAGCRAPCDRLASRAAECGQPADALAGQCRSGDPPGLAACAREDDCAALTACVAAATQRSRAGDDARALREAAAARDWGAESHAACRPPPGQALPPELAAACADFQGQALADLALAVTAQRDRGERDFAACYHVEQIAALAPGPAADAAALACAEADAAQLAREVIAEARRLAQERRPTVPLGCQSAPEALARLGTDWALQQARAVASACYLELGRVVLEERVPQMGAECDEAAGAVIAGYLRHGLEDPAVAEWVAQAAPRCNRRPGP